MGCKSSRSGSGNGGNNGRECVLSYPEDCIPSPTSTICATLSNQTGSATENQINAMADLTRSDFDQLTDHLNALQEQENQ